jgi:type I restriction-modification system DNA methylase subunit
MQCVLATSGAKYELKQRLLEKHTLEAVFSMPDELFINSDVGVVTAVIIITAHKPHSKHKETFFGYWKDDGFVKKKNKGRINANNCWEKVKQEWVGSYVNRKSIPGKSVNVKVSAIDEWCAEAFMETDYSDLEDSDFVAMVREYSSFLVKSDIANEVE